MYLFRFWNIFVQILKLIGETNGPYEGRWNLEEHVLILVLLSYSWNVFVYILKCICLHFAMYLSTFWNEFVFILQCICLDFEMYLFRFCGEISDLSTFVVFRNPKFLHMTNVSPYPIYVRYVTNVRYELLILIFILILAISQ